MMDEAERIAAALSEAQKRAVTVAFAGPFCSRSKHGMMREWADVCAQAGRRRSFNNTIQPLIRRGLAERVDCESHFYFVRLTPLGLAVRRVLQNQEPSK